MLIVMPADTASDLKLRVVVGATRLEGWVWVDVVGSRRGWEEVEASCSWVAIVYALPLSR
jgi:hypothetical protein